MYFWHETIDTMTEDLPFLASSDRDEVDMNCKKCASRYEIYETHNHHEMNSTYLLIVCAVVRKGDHPNPPPISLF